MNKVASLGLQILAGVSIVIAVFLVLSFVMHTDGLWKLMGVGILMLIALVMFIADLVEERDEMISHNLHNKIKETADTKKIKAAS